jgi:hypothetical protein
MRFTEDQYDKLIAGRASAAKPKAAGKAKLQALGRLKPGEMNKTEKRYAEHLEAEKQAGEILWYAFEAIKLKLADRTYLTVDFFVLRKDGSLEAHDCKGAKAIVTDDARVKMKVAASMFPWPFFFAYPVKGGGWQVECTG